MNILLIAVLVLVSIATSIAGTNLVDDQSPLFDVAGTNLVDDQSPLFDVADQCIDHFRKCPIWKAYCTNAGPSGEFMRRNCPKTCGLCPSTNLVDDQSPLFDVADECRDHSKNCPIWKAYCTDAGTSGEFIRQNCPKTCGLCPTHGKTIPPHVGGCGNPDIKGITRVIAGKRAVRGSWPWQILMLFSGRAICGGTLIAPQWVVTAAHCVYRREHSDLFSIRVGDHDRFTNEGSEVEIKVARVFRHPLYNQSRLDNDIAMFKLEKPVTFNKYVSPACLPKKKVPVGSQCYITGWGKTHHPGTMTRYLQQGVLPVVSNKVCYEKNHHKIPIPITDAMICGGSGGTDRQSGCHGDSGGPFVCEVDGVWELHGSVSYGSPVCKSTETYTVFSRTYHFLDWIKENMKK